MRYLKLEAVAKSKGGRRDSDPIIPSIYQNEWTPEEEHRNEFALGHIYTDASAQIGSLLYGAAWRTAKALGYKTITI